MDIICKGLSLEELCRALLWPHSHQDFTIVFLTAATKLLPTLIRTEARCLASSTRTGRASKLVEFPSWGFKRLASCGWVTFPCILPSPLLDFPSPLHHHPILRAAVPFISKSPFLTTHLSSAMFHPVQRFGYPRHLHPWSLQGHETFVSVKSQQRQNISFQKTTIH